MDWSNETWVKLYRRDTADWLLLSWRARGLMCLLLRAVSRQGTLDLGRTGPRAVAALMHAGPDVVEVMAALDELLADGCVTIEGQILRVTNFVAAQEAVLSARARAKAHRDRVREDAEIVTKRDGPVTKSDETVTRRNAASRTVTKRREEKRREETPSEEVKEEVRRKTPRPDEAAPPAGTPAARAVAALDATIILRGIMRRPHALCLAAVRAYPALDLAAEIARADAWLTANPANAKSDGDRYLNGWLSRAQERAPRVGGASRVGAAASSEEIAERLPVTPNRIIRGGLFQ